MTSRTPGRKIGSALLARQPGISCRDVLSLPGVIWRRLLSLLAGHDQRFEFIR